MTRIAVPLAERGAHEITPKAAAAAALRALGGGLLLAAGFSYDQYFPAPGGALFDMNGIQTGLD